MEIPRPIEVYLATIPNVNEFAGKTGFPDRPIRAGGVLSIGSVVPIHHVSRLMPTRQSIRAGAARYLRINADLTVLIAEIKSSIDSVRWSTLGWRAPMMARPSLGSTCGHRSIISVGGEVSC